jgi:hypothetical protein
MTKLTFYNLGNADCCRIDFYSEERMLVDYADTRDPNDKNDKRSDLPTLLWEDLDDQEIDTYKVVAFTHLDNDHVSGSSDFFYFKHAKKYQDGKRAKIDTLWVPAAAITEEGLDGDGRIIREEAKYRLKEGKDIIVFSRPDRLKDWLEKQGIRLEDRAHLIVDAGNLVPGFSLAKDAVEFFAHSPHAHRTDERGLEDRNSDSLVFQARFKEGGHETDALFSADVTYEDIGEIVNITRHHKNDSRLHWNIYKLPHHCSYTAVGLEKGGDKTVPTEEVKWLCETQGEKRGYVVSTSRPIPDKETKEDKDVQPPHRQAANYYREDVVEKDRFLVSMEEPNALNPKPIVIEIGSTGATLKSAGSVTIAAAVATAAPRAG